MNVVCAIILKICESTGINVQIERLSIELRTILCGTLKDLMFSAEEKEHKREVRFDGLDSLALGLSGSGAEPNFAARG